ncbi:hypothetical protein [Streptomyces sp. 7N604]|uniref:hypothetical protein n=1 Tax=Streptomyces sp. 7N604 TaxID=3457415 RepID=UPI003FD212D4
MEEEPRGALSLDDWIDQFRQAAEAKVRNELGEEGNIGALRELTINRSETGGWAVASFSIDDRPGVTFVWSQQVAPDLSAKWEPDFAAMLFSTHLIEWYHTEAKRRPPGADGVIRN